MQIKNASTFCVIKTLSLKDCAALVVPPECFLISLCLCFCVSDLLLSDNFILHCLRTIPFKERSRNNSVMPAQFRK